MKKNISPVQQKNVKVKPVTEISKGPTLSSSSSSSPFSAMTNNLMPSNVIDLNTKKEIKEKVEILKNPIKTIKKKLLINTDSNNVNFDEKRYKEKENDGNRTPRMIINEKENNIEKDLSYSLSNSNLNNLPFTSDTKSLMTTTKNKITKNDDQLRKSSRIAILTSPNIQKIKNTIKSPNSDSKSFAELGSNSNHMTGKRKNDFISLSPAPIKNIPLPYQEEFLSFEVISGNNIFISTCLYVLVTLSFSISPSLYLYLSICSCSTLFLYYLPPSIFICLYVFVPLSFSTISPSLYLYLSICFCSTLFLYYLSLPLS